MKPHHSAVHSGHTVDFFFLQQTATTTHTYILIVTWLAVALHTRRSSQVDLPIKPVMSALVLRSFLTGGLDGDNCELRHPIPLAVKPSHTLELHSQTYTHTNTQPRNHPRRIQNMRCFLYANGCASAHSARISAPPLPSTYTLVEEHSRSLSGGNNTIEGRRAGQTSMQCA